MKLLLKLEQHDAYLSVVPIHKELSFGMSLSRRDGGSIELVEYSTLALTLFLQTVRLSCLTEHLYTIAGGVSHTEQGEGFVVCPP